MTLFEPDAGRVDSLFPYDLDTIETTPLALLNLPRELAPGVIAYPTEPEPEPEPEAEAIDNSAEATAQRRAMFAGLGWSTTER
jgi:hypothetical protein